MKHFIFFLLFLFSYSYVEAQVAPSSISGLQIWFRADTGVVFDPLTNKVSEWKDLSGNNNHAIQASFSSQPLLLDSVRLLNNKSVLLFDGFDDYFDFPDQANLYTVFLVLKYDTITDFQTILGNDAAYDFISGPGSAFFHSQFTNSGILTGRTFINGSPVTPSQLQKPSEFSIVEVQASSSFSVGNIGKERNFPWFFQGKVAEIIVYNDSIDQIERIGIENYLRERYAPAVNLGPDYTIAYGFCEQVIKADDRFLSYLWSTGATQDSIITNEGGTFSITVTDIFGFSSADTVSIQFPLFGRPSRSVVCLDDTVTWNTGLSSTLYDFNWNNGSIQPFIDITSGGLYFVQIVDTNGCSISDSINFSLDNFSEIFSLGQDTQYCSGSVIMPISGSFPGNTYLWSTGDTTPYSIATSPGVYSVSVLDSNSCLAKDSILITISGSAAVASFSEGLKCEGLPVQFTDMSLPPTGANVVYWNWSFGDNESSSLMAPKHLYSDTGTYMVRLVIRTDQGCTSAFEKNIRITSKPKSLFNPSNSCENTYTQFINNSFSIEPISSFFWEFGTSDSSNNSSLTNPQFIYTNEGTYLASLITTTIYGCSDTTSRTITVNPKPVASFTTSPACDGKPTWFADNSIIPFPWTIIPGSVKYEFGDGYTGTTPSAYHIYQDTGSYNVSYYFTLSNGCRDTITKQVHVYSPPVASFTSPTICEGVEVTFSSTSSAPDDFINGWSWSLDSVPVSADSVFSFLDETPGTAHLELTVTTNNGCTDSEERLIETRPSPLASFTVSSARENAPATISFSNNSSGATSYLFDFGDGSASLNSFPASHIYSSPGIFTPVLTAVSPFGCKDTASVSITVLEKFVDVAINNLYYSVSDSFLTVTAEFVNLGSNDISDLDVILELRNGSLIKDKLPATLRYQGNPVVHTFSSVRITEENSSFCVRSEKPDGEDDMRPENNSVCRSISSESFDVILYPNPASDQVFADIMAQAEGFAEISIYDSRGRLALTKIMLPVVKGLTRYGMNVSGLNKGIYTIHILSGDSVLIKKLVVE